MHDARLRNERCQSQSQRLGGVCVLHATFVPAALSLSLAGPSRTKTQGRQKWYDFYSLHDKRSSNNQSENTASRPGVQSKALDASHARALCELLSFFDKAFYFVNFWANPMHPLFSPSPHSNTLALTYFPSGRVHIAISMVNVTICTLISILRCTYFRP